MVKKTKSIWGQNTTFKDFSHPDWFLPYAVPCPSLYSIELQMCVVQGFHLDGPRVAPASPLSVGVTTSELEGFVNFLI